MADEEPVKGCQICGAAVVNAAQHARWHDDLDSELELLDEVEVDATTALQKADVALQAVNNRTLFEFE